MNELAIYECRKYTVQIFKWLKSRYSDNLYDFLVLEDDEIISMKIKMNVSIKFYEKRGLGIINYIIKTFRRPELIKINWRYNHNMFEINVFCGQKNEEIYMSDNEK